MRLALAQIASVPLDVEANVRAHVAAVEAAAGADLVQFPELSLTGYELDAPALDPDDPRLDPLRGLPVAAGLPTRRDGRRFLSMLVGSRTYDKRNLYGAEPEFFDAGVASLVVPVGDRRVHVGVCADLHDDAQADEVTDVWSLGVLLSPNGYEADADRAADVARRCGVVVALTNHAAPTGGWDAAGRSGVWFPDGTAITADAEPGVWVVDLEAREIARVG